MGELEAFAALVQRVEAGTDYLDDTDIPYVQRMTQCDRYRELLQLLSDGYHRLCEQGKRMEATEILDASRTFGQASA